MVAIKEEIRKERDDLRMEGLERYASGDDERAARLEAMSMGVGKALEIVERRIDLSPKEAT